MGFWGLALIWAGIAAGQTLGLSFDRPEIIYFGDRPMWNGPFLTSVEKNDTSSPFIWTLDPFGEKEEIPFPIPGVARFYIHDRTASGDGTLILVGEAVDQHGVRSGVVATIPRGRKRAGMIRDEAFWPHHVAVTRDGVMWVIGGQAKSVDVLKRFSPSGKLLTSQAVPDLGGNRGFMLRAAADRVGWLGDKAYIEFALDGSILSRFPAPPLERHGDAAVLAIRGDREVVAQTGYGLGPFWSLDRARRCWDPFDGSGRLMGFDGDQLVLAQEDKNRGWVIAHYLFSNY
jgi:hypothetical protein